MLVVHGAGTRTGLIIGIVGEKGTPPYVVKWLGDGHIAMVTPDQYSRIRPASSEGSLSAQRPAPVDQ